jgi:hypothetical protein
MPISPERTQEIIEAVRSHAVIGRGTCSPVDECDSDAELIEQLEEDDAEGEWTVDRAVKFFLEGHDLWDERRQEVESYIF